MNAIDILETLENGYEKCTSEKEKLGYSASMMAVSKYYVEMDPVPTEYYPLWECPSCNSFVAPAIDNFCPKCGQRLTRPEECESMFLKSSLTDGITALKGGEAIYAH